MKVETENVQIKLGDNYVLKGMDINVDNKEFVGIIGPNGCGKSTFLKCIYKVLKCSDGKIKFDEKNINDISFKESAKKISVVGQHNYYNFDFTVEEVVLMGRTPHKKFMERDNANDYKLVHRMLGKVGMLDFSKRDFGSLSGGEQQRVILARALVQDTQCIILDEPTNHLDIKYQLQIMNIVKSLNVEVIAVVHDLNIAAMYCDKIYVMNKGKVVAYGKPSEVLTKEIIKEVYGVKAKILKNEKNEKVYVMYEN